jgi:hypothetical protein
MLECSWNFVGEQIVSNFSVDYLDQLLLGQLEKCFKSLSVLSSLWMCTFFQLACVEFFETLSI